MNEQTAIVIGATGLIGHVVVEVLLKDPAFRTVRILVREKTGLSHLKLEEKIVNFNDIDDFSNKFGRGDVIFSCVGTTQKKVHGDKIAYKKVDFDIPVNAAKIGIANGFKKYMLVSSVGANATSKNFYLKLKGETEDALKEFSFESIGFFQPSILLGERNERRSGEQFAKMLMRTFSKLLIGGYKKYRAIDAKDVAAAMVNESKMQNPGVHSFEYAAIMKIANDESV